jgi:hypothetical protein
MNFLFVRMLTKYLVMSEIEVHKYFSQINTSSINIGVEL